MKEMGHKDTRRGFQRSRSRRHQKGIQVRHRRLLIILTHSFMYSIQFLPPHALFRILLNVTRRRSTLRAAVQRSGSSFDDSRHRSTFRVSSFDPPRRSSFNATAQRSASPPNVPAHLSTILAIVRRFAYRRSIRLVVHPSTRRLNVMSASPPNVSSHRSTFTATIQRSFSPFAAVSRIAPPFHCSFHFQHSHCCSPPRDSLRSSCRRDCFIFDRYPNI